MNSGSNRNESDPDFAEAQRGNEDLAQLTWRGVTPLGHSKALGELASGPMAILAGFSLASATVLGTQSNLEDLDYAALILFGVSSAVLLWGLHLTAEAAGLHASPNDYVEWYPELRYANWKLSEEIRRRQREEFAAYFAVRRRGLEIYHSGTALTLSGLGCFVLARVDGDGLSLELSRDTITDAALITCSAVLLVIALGVLSYGPGFNEWSFPRSRGRPSTDERARNLSDIRYDRAVRRGARHLIKTSGLSDEEAEALFKETIDPIGSPLGDSCWDSS